MRYYVLRSLVKYKKQDKGLRKPKGQSRMDNTETLVTFGTQETVQKLEKTEGSIKNGQSRDTGNIWYTRNRTKVRENRRVNQERTIQRHW